MAIELFRDGESFEHESVIVKNDGDSWSIRKLNYHTIFEDLKNKQKAVCEANEIARYVNVEE